MYKCQDCTYSSNRPYNLRRHEKAMHTHSKEIFYLGENQPTNTISSMNHDVYDVRLKENFKIFISGPSRCGKTVFVSNLLERINEFTKVNTKFTSQRYLPSRMREHFKAETAGRNKPQGS